MILGGIALEPLGNFGRRGGSVDLERVRTEHRKAERAPLGADELGTVVGIPGCQLAFGRVPGRSEGRTGDESDLALALFQHQRGILARDLFGQPRRRHCGAQQLLLDQINREVAAESRVGQTALADGGKIGLLIELPGETLEGLDLQNLAVHQVFASA